MKNIGLISLGCSKNMVDSQEMLFLFLESGFHYTENLCEADIIVINSCSFIKEAREEYRQTIQRALKLKSKGKLRYLVVTGCLPERYNEELLLKGKNGKGGVDLFVGLKAMPDIVKFLRNLDEMNDENGPRLYLNPLPHYQERRQPSLYAYAQSPFAVYLKIADGCSNHCSYCIVPKIRGEQKSNDMEAIINSVKGLISRGVKEINIVAQDSGSYGLDLFPPLSFEDLLLNLAHIEGDFWIRVLYCHPKRVSQRLIEVIQREGKICKYMDMPIQHINDGILQRMNRGIDKKSLIEIIANLKETIPSIVLRTSFIIGFPGEGEREFSELTDFVKNYSLDNLGVFKYSREKGTKAAEYTCQVKEATKISRRDSIMRIQREISLKNNQRYLGSLQRVLVEKVLDEKKGTFKGRASFHAPEVDGFILLRSKGSDIVHLGQFVHALITRASYYYIEGEIQRAV